MKIELTSQGDLVVKPEGTIERLALQSWVEGRQTGKTNGQFMIDLSCPPMPPSAPVDSRFMKAF